MNRKIGKFKMWQLLAIGGVTGFIIYEYTKNKTPSETPVGLAGATRPEGFPTGGGGGEGALGSVAAPAPGAPGEPGPAGAPGAPAQAEVTRGDLAGLEAQIAGLNQPPPTAASSKPAPHPATKFPLRNPVTGEHYRLEKHNGQTVHVYHSGKRVVVGGAKANRKTANNKHQAAKHGQTKSHPANPNHRASHAAPVAAHQHSRSAPLAKRVTPTHPAHPAPKKAPPKPRKRR